MMAEGKAPESASSAGVPDGHGLAWRSPSRRPAIARGAGEVAVRIRDLESRDAGEGTDPRLRAGAERAKGLRLQVGPCLFLGVGWADACAWAQL